MIREAQVHLLADSREYNRIQKKNDLAEAIERAKYKVKLLLIN
jgi:hypothetical protein